MPNEVTGLDLINATTRNTRAIVAAALVTLDAYNPIDVNMRDAESKRAYAAKLNEAIELVFAGIAGVTS